MKHNKTFLIILGVIVLACVFFFVYVKQSTAPSSIAPNINDGYLQLAMGEMYTDNDFLLFFEKAPRVQSPCHEIDDTCLVVEITISGQDDGTFSTLLPENTMISIVGKNILWKNSGEVIDQETTPLTLLFGVSDQPFETPLTYTGTFEDFQFGDYGHITINDALGNERTFWLGDDVPYEVLNAFIDGNTVYPDKKGDPVRVTWMRVKKFVPEAEGEMYQDVIIDLEEIL